MAADRAEVSMGFTQNLGNFTSLRLDFGWASDRKDDETEEEAFKRVLDFVDERFGPALDELTSKVKGTIEKNK